ncbi:hypothetical protein ACFQ2K_45140 [Streptomyces sanglieri]|uniref:Uncharacterized protein n=1 Tax=Streptomyces sanglieri TaxID=193460 RepID=A0ABW2X4Z7_9ACTN
MATARQYLSYTQGPRDSWEAPDRRLLRPTVPENRRRAHDVRSVLEGRGRRPFTDTW